MSEQGLPNLGVALGLGPNWQPGSCSWEWHELGTANGGKVYAFKINTVGGTMGMVLAPDDLRTLLAQITERLTGLVVAQPGDVPRGMNGGPG